MIQEAIIIYNRTSNFMCTPTVESLNSSIWILCKKRECLRVVPHNIADNKSMNIRIEESSFLVLNKSLCKINRTDDAIQLLKYMIDDGFTLEGRICSSLLLTICDHKHFSGAEVISGFDDLRRLGFCPDRVLSWTVTLIMQSNCPMKCFIFQHHKPSELHQNSLAPKDF